MIIKKDVKWLSQGCQKETVLRVVKRPMCPSEILREAKAVNPRISFGDASNIIRKLEKRGILKCLTPERLTGRIYFLTNYGRRLVWRALSVEIDAEKLDFNWSKYAFVLAGGTRKPLLLELYRSRGFYPDGINIAMIRKKLSRTYPFTFSQVFNTVMDLKKEGLIRISGHAKKRAAKLYKPAADGVRIAEYILKSAQTNHKNPF